MSWADGFGQYLQTYEVRLHRRSNTFGGKLWPARTRRLLSPQTQLEIAMKALEQTERKTPQPQG